jgi:hypothetical protein
MQPSLGRLTGSSAGGNSRYLNSDTAVATPAGPKKQVSPWLTLLPSAAAAGASFIPGVGTVAAAGLGGIGEALRQKAAGEDFNLGSIAKEAALSAIPGGLGLLAKGAKLAKTVNIGRQGLKAAEAGAEASSVASSASKGGSLLDKITQAGQNVQGKARGITPGATATGQDQLGVEGANQLNDFLSSVGVKSGSAQGQLSKLEQLHKGWVNQLGEVLNTRNVPLTPSSVTAVKDKIMAQLGNIAKLPTTEGAPALVDSAGKAIVSAGAGPDHALVKTFMDKLAQVKDVKDLNKLRQQIDEGINFARKSATPDPLAEQVSTAFRRGISDAMGDLAPETKGINELLSKSYDAQDFLKNAAKNPAGFNLFGMKVGGPALQAGTAAAGAATTGAADVAGKVAGSGLFQFGKTAIKGLAQQGGVRAGAAAMGAYGSPDGAQAPVPTQPVQDPSMDPGAADMAAGAATDGPNGVFTPEMLQQLALNDIASTGGKNLDKIATLDKLFGSGSAKSTKPLSAEANKQSANAQNGLRALSNLQQMLKSDPSLPLKDLAPGSVGRGITGAGQYEAARQEIVDVLARLRTGAAISKTEEARFKSQLPQVGDSADTIQYKLGLYQDLFSNILQRGQQGSPDLETLGLGAAN